MKIKLTMETKLAEEKQSTIYKGFEQLQTKMEQHLRH